MSRALHDPSDSQPKGPTIDCQPIALAACAPSPSARDWLLWQLVDSAFPTGGYAHSNGLEAAWQHGEVRSGAALVSYLEAALEQLGHAQLPFVTTAHAEPGRLAELDQLCDAFTSNHVANRASRLQGRAFYSAVTRVFGVDLGAGPPEQGRGKGALSPPLPPALPFACGHLAPVFGAVTCQLGLDVETSARMFVFGHLRGLLAAGVRLNIVGAMESQRLQHQLSARAECILAECATLGLDDLAQTAPLLDLWQGAHDRLYSRLFQS